MRGEEVLENGETLSPEVSALVDQAIRQLSSWELPCVWVGKPYQDETGKLVGSRVAWSRLSGMKEEIRSNLLPPQAEKDLFEESIYVLAAKQELVVIKKVLPRDEVTSEEAPVIAALREVPAEGEKDHRQWDLDPNCSWPTPEEWVSQDMVALFELPSNERSTIRPEHFIRVVAKDALSTAYLPYIEDFLLKATNGPSEYVIEATDEVMFALSVLEDVEQI